jgi:hypothetical protein
MVGSALVKLRTRVGVNVSQLEHVDEWNDHVKLLPLKLLPLGLLDLDQDLERRIGRDVTIDDNHTHNAADAKHAKRTHDDDRAIRVLNGTGSEQALLVGNRLLGLGNGSAVVRLRE